MSMKYLNTFFNEITVVLLSNESDKFNLLKGVIEFGNILESVLGLAILAPEVSHLIVNPTMNLLGIEKK